MVHIFKYSFKQFLRNKAELFWLLLFPILLGTMFKLAFSGIGENTKFQAIPVAIVCDESKEAETFRTIADKLGEKGEEQFLDITYCTEEDAKELLKDEKADGILYASDTVTLTLLAENGSDNMNGSILNSFVEQYHLQSTAISEILATHPEKIEEAVSSLEENVSCIREVSLSKNEKEDSMDQYFYNLLTMACLFTSISGVFVAVYNEGNLSEIGARKNVSSAHKLKVIAGELLACILTRFCCNMAGFLYVAFVLKVNITTRLPFAILALFAGCMTGVTFGFFFGSLGKMQKETREGIIFALQLFCCFLSGLMVGNMRQIVEDFCPFINKINPAALISDSFYALVTYDGLDRYAQNIGTLFLWSAVFIIGGFFMTRRKKYANL